MFRPRGLDPARRYEVTQDNTGSRYIVDGRSLMQQGIRVRLDAAQTSELLLFRPAGR